MLGNHYIILRYIYIYNKLSALDKTYREGKSRTTSEIKIYFLKDPLNKRKLQFYVGRSTN